LQVKPENIPLDFIYEDDDLIVINKPPGLVVHPGIGNRTGTLANALAHHCTTLSNVGGEYRPGIVHRLDKDTSGIIIAAKNNIAHNLMAKKFEKREIKKYYLALVWGKLKDSSGKIITNIGSCFTGRGINKGNQLIYVWENPESYNYSVNYENGNTIAVTYTISSTE